MNVIKYLFSYIRMLTEQQQRHYNNVVSNECTKIQILNENSTFNRVNRKERKIMKNEALKQLSDKVTDLAEKNCNLELAVNAMSGLLYDITPKDRESREQVAEATALMVGLKMMADDANNLACELEKEVPSTNTADKN